MSNKYYEQTVEKMLRLTLFADSSERNNNPSDMLEGSDLNHRSSVLKADNMLLANVKRELLKRGNYHQIDNKCQSFKSFISLIESNRLFSELKQQKDS